MARRSIASLSLAIVCSAGGCALADSFSDSDGDDGPDLLLCESAIGLVNPVGSGPFGPFDSCAMGAVFDVDFTFACGVDGDSSAVGALEFSLEAGQYSICVNSGEPILFTVDTICFESGGIDCTLSDPEDTQCAIIEVFDTSMIFLQWESILPVCSTVTVEVFDLDMPEELVNARP